MLCNERDVPQKTVMLTNFHSVQQGSLPSACDKECKTFAWTDPALTSNEQQGSAKQKTLSDHT